MSVGAKQINTTNNFLKYLKLKIKTFINDQLKTEFSLPLK